MAMFDNFDINDIQDENARQLIRRLLNLVKQLPADLCETQAGIQHLRDKINHLKGEQGKPDDKGNVPKGSASDRSSEKERRKTSEWHKRNKKAEIKVNREQVEKIEAGMLPTDAEFKGCEACDDAPQFNGQTETMSLCWVHEGRPYKKFMLHNNLAELGVSFYAYLPYCIAGTNAILPLADPVTKPAQELNLGGSWAVA